MACMCGDTRCGSCGPAQGNGRCGACGKWADDDPPMNARGNAMVLAALVTPDCWCALCTIAREMMPCDDPEECARAERQMAEQEEQMARAEQVSDEEFAALQKEAEEDERSAEEFWKEFWFPRQDGN